MNHRIQLKKLSKTSAHRKAMIRNMLVALFRHERIKTTLAKSKVLQRVAERMITRARKDTLANRRLVAKWVQDKEIHAKLFTSIAPLFIDRKGGYTRITKLGQRYGDASEMVYISLVSFTIQSEDSNTTVKKSNNKVKLANKNKENASTQQSHIQSDKSIDISKNSGDKNRADTLDKESNSSTMQDKEREQAMGISSSDDKTAQMDKSNGDASSKAE